MMLFNLTTNVAVDELLYSEHSCPNYSRYPIPCIYVTLEDVGLTLTRFVDVFDILYTQLTTSEASIYGNFIASFGTLVI